MPSSLLSWPLPSRPPVFSPAKKLSTWLRPALHLGCTHGGGGGGLRGGPSSSGPPRARTGRGAGGLLPGRAHSGGCCGGGGGGRAGVGWRVRGARGTSSAPRCTFLTRILREAKLHSRHRASRPLPRSSVPAPLPGLLPEHPSPRSTHPLPNPGPARGAR